MTFFGIGLDHPIPKLEIPADKLPSPRNSASGSFAIYKGVGDTWLPAHYKGHADNLRAAARVKMDSLGFVQGVCGAADFDRPGISTEAQAFCITMGSAGGMLKAAHSA